MFARKVRELRLEERKCKDQSEVPESFVEL